MFSYIPNTKSDERKMLQDIGLESSEQLFEYIPEELRLNRKLDLGEPLSEYELTKHMSELSNENKSLKDLVCFLGAGAYDHYVPALIDHLRLRSEFYTAYTPYQPEISQGTLQAIFEYQTLICNLTGMDVANSSMYDGATALTEAAMMSVNITKNKKVLISKTVHPESIKILKTYAKFKDIEVVEVEHEDGVTNIAELKRLVDNNTASVIVQNPNFFGIIEDLSEIEKVTHSAKKAKLIVSVDPISLGILKAPGEIGADVVVGEGQSLGNSLSFGGPYLGFMAAKRNIMRKLPGRIVGKTVDVDGKVGYVLTLQAREQHIRREKATSNICSDKSLNALAAAIYLSTLGKQGIREVALQCTQKAHYAFNEITKSGKYKPAFNKSFFKEFVIESDIDNKVITEELMKNGILGGYDLSKDLLQWDNKALYCVTEKRTKQEIDKLSEVLEGLK